MSNYSRVCFLILGLAVILTILPLCQAAQAPSTISVSAPPNSVFGAAATLTATIGPPSATGQVTFYDGPSILGMSTISAGQAILTTKLLGVGARTLRAHYAGDGNDLASDSIAVALTVTPVAAGGFQPAVNYQAGLAPNGVVVGDFNADGKIDLATSTFQSGVNILLGNGDGTFQPALNSPAGGQASSLAAGDFNGDGKLDLAVTNYTEKTISILLGNGDGTFQAPKSNSVPTGPVAIVVADFNGDGKADMAVAYGTSNLRVYVGNGDGTFQPAVLSDTGNVPVTLATGDFNGDGKADIAVAYLNGGGMAVLLGNGDGTLQHPLAFLAGGFSNGSIVGDFNGDGKLDLVTGLFQAPIAAYLGNGDGTFQTPVTTDADQNYTGTFVAGDFNGDGKLDIAISDAPAYGGYGFTDAVTVLIGNGDGTFQPPLLYNVGTGPSYALAVADFNGDGRTDLVATTYTEATLGVLLGQQAVNPTVSAVSVSPSSGAGVSQIFTLTYTDTAGAVDLARVSLLIGSASWPPTPGCVVTYNVALNTLVLWNDDGSVPANGITPGSGFEQNSSCLMDSAQSNVVLAGNLLTLNVAIAFRSRFAVSRKTYGEAVSSTGTSSGWQQLGTWSGIAATPQVISVTPASVTRAQQTLTFTFSDANSAADLSSLVAVVTAAQTPTFPQAFVSSCFVSVDPIGASVMLANDLYTGWLGPIALGGGGSLQNSQCTVYPQQSNGVFTAHTYTLALSIQLRGAGTRNIYGEAVAGTLLSGFQNLGTWTPLSPCDVSADGSTSVADVQGIINEVLGASPAIDDLNNDQAVNVADIQIVINAVLSSSCTAI